jgi:acetyltransferase
MLEEHYLTTLFEPKSVAVIGASDRENSVGNVIFRNIIAGDYKGRLYPINPKHDTIQGIAAYKSIEEIGARVDLAVIATKPQTVPGIIEQCGRSGVKQVVIITAGFSEAGHAGASLERKMLEIARSYGVRIVGPNCLGLIRPAINLNATFAKVSASPGNLALVSQSGALCAAILDWAQANDVGFSTVVSMGGSSDVDFGELLDYLVYDNRTHYILLYVEGIRNSRRFMSALRSAARIKPIVLLKAGRYESGSTAAQTHSGMTAGSDAVFDAAVKRAGVVRVKDIGQLFYAAKGMASKFRPRGNRLLIMTNGGGPGAMAADHAAELGLSLSQLSPETITALNACLPSNWSHANPVDLVGDATPQRYHDAIVACMKDPEVDALLVMLTPQAMTDPEGVAQAVIAASEEPGAKPIVACWMGETQTLAARETLTMAGIPAFRMPETAVDLFSHISTYYRNQKLLLQTPEPISKQAKAETEGAKLLIEAVLSERRKVLSEMESKSVLRTFKIPVAQTMVARTPTESLLLAEQIGFPVALKVDSPDIARKSEVGGVRLNITNAAAVRNAYHDILETVGRNNPTARINGVSIEPFVARPNGRELKLGVVRDRVFGPVITFGVGGNESEVFSDTAIALPPLNGFLAEDLIRSTRAFKILGEHRNMPPVNLEALQDVLLRISEMVCELPWIQELDLNPLIVDENGAIAADARIVIDFAPVTGDRYSHMAIHPYPVHLVEEWVLPDGQIVTIRPIRPEDAEMEKAFVTRMSDESKYFRFMDTIRELTQSMLVRFTQIDYDREMAFIAVTEENGEEVQVGVSRYVLNPDGETVEFALAVSDDWQKRSVGRKLMTVLIDCARAKGYRAVVGDVLALNGKMFKLMTSLGFTIHPHPDDPSVKRVIKPLDN